MDLGTFSGCNLFSRHMKRERLADKAGRAEQIMAVLRSAYPDAHCELSFANPLELLIATILSAQSTDRQVNVVTKSVFKKYREATDYAKVSLAELENDLKSIGLYRNKARNIQSCCRLLVERHGGRVPESMAELLELDGVGRKTANVVLGNAFELSEGIVVDTHVARLSQRLGLASSKDPEKIERELQGIVPRERWTLFSHWLIWHGRRRCFARNPDCEGCEIRTVCPTAGMHGLSSGKRDPVTR